jgi:23S rRNA (pseudouridine1915-N3)-methyltransferase
MAKITGTLAAVGKMAGQPLAEAEHEYARRLGGIKLQEVHNRHRIPAAALQMMESKALMAATEGHFRIVLDPLGEMLDSIAFANKVAGWQAAHGRLGFLIGGADGHTDELRKAAGARLSLGPMILPHLLARVVLLEQLYRAECILSGHPYHRA